MLVGCTRGGALVCLLVVFGRISRLPIRYLALTALLFFTGSLVPCTPGFIRVCMYRRMIHSTLLYTPFAVLTRWIAVGITHAVNSSRDPFGGGMEVVQCEAVPWRGLEPGAMIRGSSL